MALPWLASAAIAGFCIAIAQLATTSEPNRARYAFSKILVLINTAFMHHPIHQGLRDITDARSAGEERLWPRRISISCSGPGLRGRLREHRQDSDNALPGLRRRFCLLTESLGVRTRVIEVRREMVRPGVPRSPGLNRNDPAFGRIESRSV